MRHAEDLALHGALPVGRHQAELGLQRLHHRARIHPFRHSDSGSRSRWRIRRKKRKAQRHQARPRRRRIHLRIVDQRDTALFQVAACLPGNIIQRRAQPRHQRHRRRIGRLALDLILALLAQIKVVARILRSFHRLPRLLADAQIRESGRNHDRLLRAANHNVHAPAVHIDRLCPQPGNPIHHQQRLTLGCFQ